MELPNVVSVIVDPTKKVRYEVIAYRSLNEQELAQTVRTYLSMAKKKPTLRPTQWDI